MSKKIKIYTFPQKGKISIREVKLFARIQEDFKADLDVENTVGFEFSNEWILNPWYSRDDGKSLKTRDARAKYESCRIDKYMQDAKHFLKTERPILYIPFQMGKSVLLSKQRINEKELLYTTYCNGESFTSSVFAEAEDEFWKIVRNNVDSIQNLAEGGSNG